MKPISSHYILGIKEGRSFLNHYPDISLDEIKGEIDAFKRLMRSHSQPMKDVFKGSLDFWKNQLEIKGKTK